MATKISVQDLKREVNAVFSNYLQFCDARRGMACCDRAAGHNGKHAHGADMALVETPEGKFWEATRIVKW